METRFDQAKAQQAVDFFERLLVHTKGTWARKPFILDPFQRHIIGSLFGWQMLDPDSEEWGRLYRIAWIEMSRGSGKSELLAGLALKLTGADDEEGAEVYGVAKDRDQATLVFNVAKRMLELAELGGGPRDGLPFVIYPTNKRIVYPKTGSSYSVIAADALGNLGQDPHGIVFDEIIAQPSGDLWDALRTGFKRLQPLMVAATTAGKDPNSFGKAEHDVSERVMHTPSLSPRRFVFITSVPKDADISDESNWHLGSPAYGSFLRPQTYRDEYHEAFVGDEDNPPNVRAQRAFLQFRMNQWLDGSIESPIPLADWDSSAGMVDELKLKGKVAYGGLCTSTVEDLTCICWTFPPVGANRDAAYQALWRFFIPEEGFASLNIRTEGRAAEWRKSGALKITSGAAIDIKRHVEQLQRDIATFDVRELAFDPNGAIGIVQPIMEDRLATVVKITAGTSGSVLMDWSRLVAEQRYFHSANPVMRWQMTCLMARQGADEVLKIDRSGSRDRVPGPVASEIALRRAIVAEAPRQSIYNERGVLGA